MSDPSLPSKEPRFTVELKLNNENLALRGFIHDILGGAVYGMIEGLKGFEDCDTLEVKVTKTEAFGKADAQD
ncbi:MAG: hypothetical protein ACI97A_000457 [Planctomycetota bacterium]